MLRPLGATLRSLVATGTSIVLPLLIPRRPSFCHYSANSLLAFLTRAVSPCSSLVVRGAASEMPSATSLLNDQYSALGPVLPLYDLCSHRKTYALRSTTDPPLRLLNAFLTPRHWFLCPEQVPREARESKNARSHFSLTRGRHSWMHREAPSGTTNAPRSALRYDECNSKRPPSHRLPFSYLPSIDARMYLWPWSALSPPRLREVGGAHCMLTRWT